MGADANRRESATKNSPRSARKSQKKSWSKGRWREDNRQVWHCQGLLVKVCCALCQMPSFGNSGVLSEMFLRNWVHTVADPT